MSMHFRKAAALVIAALLAAAALTGCSVNVNPADSDTPAMVVCGEKVYLDEVKLYVYASQFDTEKQYSDLLIASYGDFKTFWVDSGYWQSSQYQGPGRVYQTKVLLKYAQANGITLTAEEKSAAEEAYRNFTVEGAKVLEYAGNPSDTVVRRYFEENALANKAYQNMVSKIDTTFDDEAMRRKTFEGIYVYAATDKPLPEDAPEGTEAEKYTEEEQKAAREGTLDVVYQRLTDGESLEDIKALYENDPTVNVLSIENRSISKEQAETLTSTYPYYEIAWELKNGEFSKDIIESSSGTLIGYALHMLNDDDPEARKNAENTELANRREAAFKEAYTALVEKYKSMHVYEDKTLGINYKGDAYLVPKDSEEAAPEATK